MRMHSVDYAVASGLFVLLSVRLSITCHYCVEMAVHHMPLLCRNGFRVFPESTTVILPENIYVYSCLLV